MTWRKRPGTSSSRPPPTPGLGDGVPLALAGDGEGDDEGVRVGEPLADVSTHDPAAQAAPAPPSAPAAAALQPPASELLHTSREGRTAGGRAATTSVNAEAFGSAANQRCTPGGSEPHQGAAPSPPHTALNARQKPPGGSGAVAPPSPSTPSAHTPPAAGAGGGGASRQAAPQQEAGAAAACSKRAPPVSAPQHRASPADVSAQPKRGPSATTAVCGLMLDARERQKLSAVQPRPPSSQVSATRPSARSHPPAALVVPVGLGVCVLDCVADAVPVPEPLPVPVALWVELRVRVALPVPELLGVPVPLPVALLVPLPVPVAALLPVPVCEALPVAVREGVPLCVAVGEPVCVGELLRVPVPLGVAVDVGSAVRLAVLEPDVDGVPVAEAVDVRLAV